jgi:hypothetical protein
MDRSRLRIGFVYGGQAVRTSAIVAVLITAALGCLEAQSVNDRDPAIPRSRDGRPNLSAPAPRLNGKPDLSGLWQAERTPMSEYVRALGPEGTKIPPDLNEITKHVLNVLWDVNPADQPLRPEGAALTQEREITTAFLSEGYRPSVIRGVVFNGIVPRRNRRAI